MQINKNIKIKSFKLKDNFNIDYMPYYIIDNGMYQFHDKITQIKFMYKYGIMCQCQRKIINNTLTYCYNNIPINQSQKEFLKKRAMALSQTIPFGVNFIKHNCNCNKKRKANEAKTR